MRRLRLALLPLSVIAATAALAFVLSATKPELETSPEAPRPRVVYVETVQEGTTSLKVASQGEVKARVDIDLVAEISGKVVYVSPEFTEGGMFQAGEVLLRIEDSDYRVAVANAQAEVARQQVAVDQVLADAEVARQQLAGVKASALGLKKPQLAEAKAGLAAAQASLQQAEINLARTEVFLPYHGRVRTDLVGVGQFVTAGTALAQVFATDVVEVRLPLTDRQLSSLGLPIGYIASFEQAPDVELTAKVAATERHWLGKLTRVDANFDSLTRVIYAVAEVRNPYSEQTLADSGAPLAVGLYVKAEISGQEVTQAKTIPREALRAGNRVYVVKDGALDIRTVAVKHTDHDTAVIAEGLDTGEQVVTSPVRNPINGLRVEAMNHQDVAQEPKPAEGDRS